MKKGSLWIFALLLIGLLLALPEALAEGAAGQKVQDGKWTAFPCDRIAHPECAKWMNEYEAMRIAADGMFDKSLVSTECYIEEKRSLLRQFLFFIHPRRIYIAKLRKMQ